MARRKEAHGGGHGWFVTFADLMGLLVSFFVMLVAFSNQDAKKMQAVAGSMREAFGVQDVVRNSGLMESEGLMKLVPNSRTQHTSDPRIHPSHRPRMRKVPASRATRPSLYRRHRCARRCRTCRNWRKPPNTS